MSSRVNLVLLSKFSPNFLNCFLHIRCEVSLVYQDVLTFAQVLQGISFLIDMLDGLVCTILPNVFSWEYKSIAISFLQWYGIMTVVNHGKSKFFEVSNKSRHYVSLGHIKC